MDYAADDAEVTFRLAKILGKNLRESSLQALLDELEMPLSKILAKMEWEGITLDCSYLDTLRLQFQKELEAVKKDIWEFCGEEFNLNSPKQLSRILFEKLGLPVVKKTKKSGPSTDSHVLNVLEKKFGYEIARKINRYRHLSKLKGTYVDPLPKLLDAEGRLHTSFHQFKTETGRLSSSEPNLQNIPIRTEEGKSIRRAFIPRSEGQTFVSADYSQIELRVLAHLTESPILKETFEKGRDIHRETAASVFAVPPDQVTSEMRSKAKAVNFGIIYGQTGFGLSKTLGIEQWEAKKMIDAYFAKLPEVGNWKERTIADARSKGYVSTLLGRRRFLPDINNSKKNIQSAAERVAINTIIQGTAADLIKKAMINLDQELQKTSLRARLLLQIHDELILECAESDADEVAAILVHIMEGAFELKVPLTASLSRGKTWADLK